MASHAVLVTKGKRQQCMGSTEATSLVCVAAASGGMGSRVWERKVWERY